MNKLIIVLVVTLVSLHSTITLADCTVTKFDGSTFTVDDYSTGSARGPVKVELGTCADLYHPDHICASVDGQALPACEIQNWIKLADWDAPQDLIIVPHRGVWGYETDSAGDFVSRDGPPENSLDALNQAALAGYHVVELDIILARDDDTDSTTTERTLMSGHFFELRRFTNYSGGTTPGTANASGPNTGGVGYTWNTDPTDILNLALKLNDRDGNPTDSHGTQFVTLEEALLLAQELDIVILIDPKTATQHRIPNPDKNPLNPADDGLRDRVCDMFCYIRGSTRTAEWLEIYDLTIDLAESIGVLANIVIKTHNPMTFEDVEAVVGEDDMHKVLWSPQSSKANGDSMDTVLAWVDGWADHHEPDIAVWDTSVFSSDWVLGQAFTFNKGDGQGPLPYDNLLDYLRINSNKRAGLWQIEPGGRRGVMDSYNQWQMTANIVDQTNPETNDLRGNFNTNVSYKWASHAAITTDRQDIYRQILTWFDQEDTQ